MPLILRYIAAIAMIYLWTPAPGAASATDGRALRTRSAPGDGVRHHRLSRPDRLGRELLPAACARGQVSALVNLTTLPIVRSRSRAARRRRRRRWRPVGCR